MLTMANKKYIELHLVISGFHCYRKYWRPNIDKKLICINVQENVFDMFLIKTCLEDGRALNHERFHKSVCFC